MRENRMDTKKRTVALSARGSIHWAWIWEGARETLHRLVRFGVFYDAPEMRAAYENLQRTGMSVEGSGSGV
jgi:hypothetical protein